eukprot:scaffold164445_cov22-Tisochrysis_lutea.AAC.2
MSAATILTRGTPGRSGCSCEMSSLGRVWPAAAWQQARVSECRGSWHADSSGQGLTSKGTVCEVRALNPVRRFASVCAQQPNAVQVQSHHTFAVRQTLNAGCKLLLCQHIKEPAVASSFRCLLTAGGPTGT